MNNIYQIISIIAFVLAGLLFIVAIILFFALNVKKSIDILSGHAEKKSIMQMQNVATANEKNSVYSFTGQDLKQTNKLSQPEQNVEEDESTMILGNDEGATVVLAENEQATVVLNDCMETQLLHGADNYIRIIKEVIYIHTDDSCEALKNS